ncbi:MAG: hypothetical protein L0H31_00630 [Nocardioidaceae bacterium]|nr:hypothetical protein [Nocardioidaceae bacterium]
MTSCTIRRARGDVDRWREPPDADAVILRNLVGITGRRAARMRSELSLITR